MINQLEIVQSITDIVTKLTNKKPFFIILYPSDIGDGAEIIATINQELTIKVLEGCLRVLKANEGVNLKNTNLENN